MRPHRWPAFLFGFYPVLEKKILNYGGRPPVKIRIMEHKEPPHFMKLFNGHIIIHKGHRKKRLTKYVTPHTPRLALTLQSLVY